MNERVRVLRVRSVPLFLIHLFKGICNVESTDFLVILKLEKLVPTMASHVHENVGTFICQETLGSRDRRLHPTSEHPDEVLNSHFVAAIVNLDVVSIKIQMSSRIGVYAARKLISQVAGCIVREHQNDIRVGDT